MSRDSDKSRISLSRRKFLTTAAVGGVTSLAGCGTPDLFNNGGNSNNVFTVRKLPEKYTLPGERKVILPQGFFQNNYELQRGQQCRLAVKGGVFGEELPGLFTIRENNPLSVADDELYLSEKNMTRIGAIPGDKISFSAKVPSADISSEDAARKTEEYIEQAVLSQQRRGMPIMVAPHGGHIEKNTASQALRVSNYTGSDSWITLGFDDMTSRATDRWFIPSQQIHEKSFNHLGDAIQNYDFAVSFHGKHESPSIDGVAIGGLAPPEYKAMIRDRIREVFQAEGVVDINVTKYETGTHDGSSPDLLVNRMTGSGRDGIIIKQSENVRKNHWQKVADGVRKGVKDIKQDMNDF